MYELVDMDLHLREHVAKNYFSRSLCNQILGKFCIALGYKGEENLKNCIYGDIPIMETIVEKASSHSETQPFISQTHVIFHPQIYHQTLTAWSSLAL